MIIQENTQENKKILLLLPILNKIFERFKFIENGKDVKDIQYQLEINDEYMELILNFIEEKKLIKPIQNNSKDHKKTFDYLIYLNKTKTVDFLINVFEDSQFKSEIKKYSNLYNVLNSEIQHKKDQKDKNDKKEKIDNFDKQKEAHDKEIAEANRAQKQTSERKLRTILGEDEIDILKYMCNHGIIHTKSDKEGLPCKMTFTKIRKGDLEDFFSKHWNRPNHGHVTTDALRNLVNAELLVENREIILGHINKFYCLAEGEYPWDIRLLTWKNIFKEYESKIKTLFSTLYTLIYCNYTIPCIITNDLHDPEGHVIVETIYKDRPMCPLISPRRIWLPAFRVYPIKKEYELTVGREQIKPIKKDIEIRNIYLPIENPYVGREQLTICINDEGKIVLENKKDIIVIVSSLKDSTLNQSKEIGKGEKVVVKDGDQITLKEENGAKLEIVSYNRFINKEFIEKEKNIVKDQLIIVHRDIFTLDS